MSWIKKKYKEKVSEIKENITASSITRKKARAEYYRTREKQQIELARKKALFQRQQRERQLKAKYGPRPARPKTTFSHRAMSLQPSSIMSTSYFASAKPKIKTVPKIIKRKKRSKRRTGKKKAIKYIIKGGVAYPVG